MSSCNVLLQTLLRTTHTQSELSPIKRATWLQLCVPCHPSLTHNCFRLFGTSDLQLLWLVLGRLAKADQHVNMMPCLLQRKGSRSTSIPTEGRQDACLVGTMTSWQIQATSPTLHSRLQRAAPAPMRLSVRLQEMKGTLVLTVSGSRCIQASGTSFTEVCLSARQHAMSSKHCHALLESCGVFCATCRRIADV